MDDKNIVLVDDHIVVRHGLRELIQKLGPFKVSHEFNNGRELIQAYPFDPTPDLILLDITMPEMNGEEAFTQLNNLGCDIPVLILTLTNDDNQIIRLFRSGVRGYLQKDCTAKTMKEAISEIFRCGYYHNDFLIYSLRNEKSANRMTKQEQIINELSERERQFLKLVCHEDEYTYGQIAGLMDVQHRTVDGYRESIFEKFSIKSKTGLVLFVLRHKLFDLLY